MSISHTHRYVDVSVTDEAKSQQDRAARIYWEAEMIAKGAADIDAGFAIEVDDPRTRLDARKLDESAPLPAPKAFRF